ncbi:unnamed protein product [Urochloa humidicola]
MAPSNLLLSLLAAVAFCGGVFSGASAANTPALDDVCGSLGGYNVTPEACLSALCNDPSSPCAAANATAARDSVAASSASSAGLRACLQLYTGVAAALQWAAGSAAAGRLPGAREVLDAARYVPSGCDGVSAGAAVPAANGGFDAMATVAHAVLASLSKGY